MNCLLWNNNNNPMADIGWAFNKCMLFSCWQDSEFSRPSFIFTFECFWVSSKEFPPHILDLVMFLGTRTENEQFKCRKLKLDLKLFVNSVSVMASNIFPLFLFFTIFIMKILMWFIWHHLIVLLWVFFFIINLVDQWHHYCGTYSVLTESGLPSFPFS